MTDTATADLSALEARVSDEITGASDLAALDAVRVAALGKKGEVSLMMKTLGKMSPEERQVMGPALNGLRNRLNEAIETRKAALETEAMNASLASETLARPVEAIEVPVLALHAGADTIFPADYIEGVFRRLPDGKGHRLRVYEGRAHYFIVDHAEEVARDVDAWLTDTLARGRSGP